MALGKYGNKKKKAQKEDASLSKKRFSRESLDDMVQRRTRSSDLRIYRPTPGRTITVIVVIVIAVLLIAAGLMYFVFIPRTSLSVQTLYHERLGGGSTGGGININILFTNDGTRKITGLEYTLTVINQSDAQVLRTSQNVGQLDAGADRELRNAFIGNHLETYYITLSVSFTVEGEGFSEDFSYKTEEDAMNLDFRDSVKG